MGDFHVVLLKYPFDRFVGRKGRLTVREGVVARICWLKEERVS